jgi:hypothetical protein
MFHAVAVMGKLSGTFAFAVLTSLAVASNIWAFDLPLASGGEVNREIFIVEMPLSAELARSGLSGEQVSLAMDLGMALFTEDYCGVRVITKGDRMAIDAKAARLGLAKERMEDAANRFDARLSWHFREDVKNPGVPLTFCRQAREAFGTESERERDI